MSSSSGHGVSAEDLATVAAQLGQEVGIPAVIATARKLYDDNQHIAYVSVFQNWLAPAGASFEHLHKQLVAIDRIGARLRGEIVDHLQRLE